MDIRSLARTITALENHNGAALRALDARAPGTGLIAGVTGPPGVGKSSLVDAMAHELRACGKTVAILAVDPSSRATGGAILGDRIRMQQHHADPGIFIRSMATRGQSGGLAAATFNAARLLRAESFDYVLIETVGVGQDEIAMASVADIVIVVLMPGMGDDVQAIKAGVMEIADLFVINKADTPGASDTASHISAMLSLAHGPTPEILETVATEPRGIAEAIRAMDALPRRRHEPPPPSVSIDHLGIAVTALEAALPFYRLLGLVPTSPENVPAEKVRASFLPTGESRIELLEATDSGSTIARYVKRRGPGLHHVALRVSNLSATLTRLRQHGVRVLNEPREGAGGHLYAFIHPESTGGVLWELIQSEGDAR